MDNLKKSLLNLFFPRFCLGCQKEGFYLCDDCRSILDISEFDFCLCSKNPIRISPLQKSGTCQRCQHKKLSGLFSALPYKEKHLTKKLIYQFKYKPYLKDLAETLANIIIEHLFISGKNTDEIWAPGGTPAILIPVPVGKEKLKERGYNQSEELAKELAKVLKIPVVSDVLIKTKKTDSQMELSQKEREINLLGAFSVSQINENPARCNTASGGAEEIRDKKIFLVDDVYTTGSTMEECAKVLLEAGANSVWGITLARESL